MKRQASNLKHSAQRQALGLVLAAFAAFGTGGLALGAALEISIAPKFSGAAIQPNSLRYQTSAGEWFSVTRVSWLASEFALQRGDGSWLELTNQIAWFDLEKGRNSFTLPNVPAGDYRSVRFQIGLDATNNHANPAQFAADHPLNPNLNGLHWNWQGGYIFMALEGMWQERQPPARLVAGQSPERAESETDAPLGWSYHFANDTNRTRVTLAAAVPLTNDTRLELDFDLATLLNAPRPLSFARDGSSTHSRDGDPIAAALAANLPGAFVVHRIAIGGASVVASRGGSETVGSPGSSAHTPLYLPEKFTPYPFKMSATFPIPDLPRDNPLIEERVKLGEELFRESALSKDGTISCASCHQVGAAFSDPRRYSMGVGEQTGTRNAMPLFNLAWKNSFFWDGRAPSLRTQALMPIQDHAEMDESLTNVAAKLAAMTLVNYRELFTAAFGSPDITPEKIGLAIEQYVLTLTSFDSEFDQVLKGEARFTDAEQRGLELFMTEYDPRREQYGADCFHCHGGPLFQSQTFANNGLDSEFKDVGRAQVTGKDSDTGKFATPSLRNVALTAPYMHDGRFTTLEQVVEHYSTGLRRSATLDPNLAKHPDGGIRLSQTDQQALVAFLLTLTDQKFAISSKP